MPPAEPPTCYRHPGRETYVRCQRCDRPICPDCMRPAAVGYQCPECVAEGRRSAPAARTTLGGVVHANPAMVTTGLIGLNVLAYLLQLAQPSLTQRYGLLPAAVAGGEYYRLFTSAFLHASVLHILFNMWALYVVGSQLEPALGRARYLVLYLLSAVGGSTLYYLIAPQFALGIGASGAVFGLFGALFVVARRLAANSGGILAIIVLNVIFSFTFPNVAWQAHLGGLLTGALVAAAYAYAPRRLRTPVGLAVPAVLITASVIAVLSRTAVLTGG